ncbi:MAG: hypothetical protein IH861_07355 [Chloroflexi bacterium]|nr:hypothetical protein [Chloroflexota bacterium]
MYIVITYSLSMMLILSTFFLIGREMFVTFVSVMEGFEAQLLRLEKRSNTGIAGPFGLTIIEASTVDITISNIGDEPLSKFEDWNVIFELRDSSSLSFAYLAYTEDASPAANEWTVNGIYRDASTLLAEVVDPNILNPGEEMIIRANPSPSVVAGYYERATISTPNGVTAKVVFRVGATLYVADSSDALAYKYNDAGTWKGSEFLDNGGAAGITTDDTDFWTTDLTDDLAYKYASNFVSGGNWLQDAANLDGAGITTDGSNIWIVDEVDDTVYKYDMSGGFDSSFSLTGASSTPTGITTNGSNIWVVDSGTRKAYKYDMAGALDSSFSLTAANTAPTGITTNGSNIWTVDSGTLKVYKYEMDGTYVSDGDITLDSANTNPSGLTILPR